MTSAKKHYEEVLAEFYSWLYGGHEAAIRVNTEFFTRHDIHPAGSAAAIDLGAGSGFQSIPLAVIGFSVTAVDRNDRLLQDLRANDPTGSIRVVTDDLFHFDRHCRGQVELIVCMTDTLLHLESRERVHGLIDKVSAALEQDGKFIVTFRDLTQELTGLDRFLPVRSDDKTIFTCFLEYGPESVNVHDIIYCNRAGSWQLYRGCYPKLRLPQQWLENVLTGAGLHLRKSENRNGLVTIIAEKGKAAA